MTDTDTQKNATVERGAAAPAENVTAEAARGRFSERGRGRGRERRGPSRGRGDRRERSEYDQKIIAIRRVARVMAGGRRFNFSVAVVIGNRKGQVGVGIGKGGDTASAIDKAVRNARKNLITVPLSKEMRIPHEVSAKFSAARVMIKPVRGRGLVAGSSARVVLELAGVKDAVAKIFSGSKNMLNNARAAVKALSMLQS